MGSLPKSFTASAKGCNSPPTDTLFGPFRACASPKIFRSTKVTNATLTRAGITTPKTVNKYKTILDFPSHLQRDAHLSYKTIFFLNKNVNFFMRPFLGGLSLRFFLAAYIIANSSSSTLLLWSSTSLNLFGLDFNVILDTMRLMFAGAVCIIRSSIFLFS